MTWALDLDGVIWLAGRGIPGSSQAVEELRGSGERALFLTNNSGPTLAAHMAALAAVGVEASEDDLVTSAQAAASLVGRGTKVALIGGEGIREALRARGAVLVAPNEAPEAVVVGRSVSLDYWALSSAAAAIRGGARFIATNTDATFPVGTPAGGEGGDLHQALAAPAVVPSDGLLPGAGALVAFVATAARRQPEVAGKPHPPMAALVRQRVDNVDVVAGDRPDTDGLFARLVGARFGLVLSGVTRRADLPVDPAPDFVGEDLLALVDVARGKTAQPAQARIGENAAEAQQAQRRM
ncbi:MAG TPA: HAD-IIA family hydrolase [Acidimicrobiales bacterium]|nr:HAD-IIA family hydrolase [Acidimicrobiales bacterium]